VASLDGSLIGGTGTLLRWWVNPFSRGAMKVGKTIGKTATTFIGDIPKVIDPFSPRNRDSFARKFLDVNISLVRDFPKAFRDVNEPIADAVVGTAGAIANTSRTQVTLFTVAIIGAIVLLLFGPIIKAASSRVGAFIG